MQRILSGRTVKYATRGLGDLLCIDQHIFKESKLWQKNVAVAWTDNKKANDMVPQTWIIECLKMYKIFRQSHKFHHGSHEKMESRINSKRENSGRDKNPKRHLPGRFAFLTTIYKGNDAYQLHY